MSAGSFPELFLQYFAWGIYNLLWDVFVNLGIVYIPFGYYLFDAYTSAREKGQNKMTASRVLAYLEMKIFLGIVVLTLAGVPTITLNLTDMKFNNRACTVGSTVATMLEVKPDATGTGTDLDMEFTTSNMGSLVSKAPVVWMAVLSVGQAISDAVRIKVPCRSSISSVAYQLQTNKINDPAVRQEIGEFYNSCYKKARAQFDSNPPPSSIYTPDMQSSGDAAWLGSAFYLNTAGYYDMIQPDNAISGFIAFGDGTHARDVGWWNGDAASKPSWSRPFCKEWYETRLRQKIIDSYDTTSWTGLVSEVQSWSIIGGNQTTSEDVLIRSLVDVSNVKTINSSQSAIEQVLGGTGYNTSGTTLDTLNPFSHVGTAQGVANAGTFAFNAVFYPTMEILKKALPLVHAFVLAGLIMFLPFLLILSQYGIKEVLTMSALLISIKFWPVIWAVGDWMQASLESAILPSMVGLNGMLTMGVAEGLSINDDVLDYVIGSWYVMGPLILSTVITLAGHQTGAAVASAAEKSNKSGDSAGQSGGGMVKQGGSMATSKGMKK